MYPPDKKRVDPLRQAITEARRLTGLLRSLRELEREYTSSPDDRRRRLITHKIDSLRVTIALICPSACRECAGTGQIAIFPARDEIIYQTCPVCDGRNFLDELTAD